jgi:hypothetical protein
MDGKKYQHIIKSLLCNSNIWCSTYDELNFPKSSTSGKGAFGIVYESEWDGIKIVIKVLNLISSYNILGAKNSFIS